MTLLPVAEAQARLLADVEPTEIETVALGAADGRTLAVDLKALRTQPPFDASAMDGYAVRAADLQPGKRLRIIGQSAAGRGFAGALAAGEAVRIFTGAPLPSGADTILIQENARRDGDHLTPVAIEAAGRHVRRRGLDFTEGDCLLRAGRCLGMREVALAAAMNHARLEVRRPPKIALIATGDELRLPGSPLGPDQIIASNSFGLAALTRTAGGAAIDLGLVADDMALIRARIRQALEAGADVICLLGGASVGDHDLTRPALEAEGMALDFWKIAMRPGKPLIFGRHGKVRMLGLPGNPVSTLVCGLLFLAPLVRKLLGHSHVMPEIEPARLGAALPANDTRQDHIRARLTRSPEGGLIATPFPIQDSAMLRIIAEAEALIVRAPFAPAAGGGERIDVIRL